MLRTGDEEHAEAAAAERLKAVFDGLTAYQAQRAFLAAAEAAGKALEAEEAEEAEERAGGDDEGDGRRAEADRNAAGGR